MKKLLLLSIVLLIGWSGSAQARPSLSEGQSALVYALPKTVFCIEVLTEKVTQHPGVFYRYSERYLATRNVITEEKTTYRIKDIRVLPQVIADPVRTFSVVPSKSSQLSKLSVNQLGILCGVNVSPAKAMDKLASDAFAVKADAEPDDLLPLGEEYMMAGSDAKLAEGAAKQIYRIRESRLGLLTADVEKLPADGASLKTMLEELNKMERGLTELFIGKTTVVKTAEKVYFTPDAAVDNQVLFRFSALRGLVAPDDLSGIPYYITVKPEPVPVTAADPKLKTEAVGLNYVIPAPVGVTMTDGVKTIYKGEFFIPQFGKILTLPESLFKQENIKVRIDPQTGRLISIE